METVPVTLGAVLPGTTAVPPLFGNAIGAVQSGTGTFLQALRNTLTESYGATKTKKVNEENSENGPPRMQDKDANAIAAATMTAPLVSRVSIQPPATASASAAERSGSGPSPNATNITSAGISPAKPAEENPEISAQLGQVSNENKRPQASARTPDKFSKSTGLADTSQTTDQVVAQLVESSHLGDASKAKSESPRKWLEHRKGEVTHSEKSDHTKDSYPKMANDTSSSPSATLPIQNPDGNCFAVDAARKIFAEKDFQEISRASGNPAMAVDVAAKPGGGDKAKLPIREACATQMQQLSPAIPTDNMQADKKLLQLASEAPLPDVAGGQTIERAMENKAQAKNWMGAHAKNLVSSSDVSLSTAKMPSSISLTDTAKNYSAARPLPLIAERQLQGPNTSTAQTQSSMPEFTHAKLKRAAEELSGPVPKQKVNFSPANDVSATNPSPQTVTRVDLDLPSGQEGNTQVQTLAAPGNHAHTSSPALLPREQTPAAPVPEGTVSALLPGERIQAARLIDRMGQTEMHLGMRTETFGSVQVHTVIRDSQVGLTVGSERGDLKGYLASEVPGLENNLRQHDLHFSDVRFVGQSFSAGGYQHSGSGSQRQSQQQGRWFPQAPAGLSVEGRVGNEIEVPGGQAAGLSVHA